MSKRINRIIFCGLNGVGKSTLGEKFAEEMGWKFMDVEKYFFPDSKTDYDQSTARTRDDVSKLLLEDMKQNENFVFAAVKGNYGEQIVNLFTLAVFVSVPKDIRMKRIRDRSYQKFGERMLKGGDMYEKEESFFEMVSKRTDKDVLDWLEMLKIPTIRVDGMLPIEENIEFIKSCMSSNIPER